MACSRSHSTWFSMLWKFDGPPGNAEIDHQHPLTDICEGLLHSPICYLILWHLILGGIFLPWVEGDCVAGCPMR